MEQSWITMAKQLHAIAKTGLEFTENEYDVERYSDIAAIALKMMANLANEPIVKIENLISPNGKGYVTPKIDVRGAVFKDNELLLVQEKSDGLWTLPGGYADVGLSAAENVEKEVIEEAGIKVRAKSLYALRHKAKGNYDPDVRDFYKLFFLCEAIDTTTVSPGAETSAAAYFSEHSLPPLSTGRVNQRDLLGAWKFKQTQAEFTEFD